MSSNRTPPPSGRRAWIARLSVVETPPWGVATALIAILSQALLSRTDQPGMVAAYEFLVITPAIANLIRENKTFRIDSFIQTGKRFGMQLLDDHLWSLYMRGMISAEEMIDKSKNPQDLSDKVHKLGRTVGRAEWDEEQDEPPAGSGSGGAKKA